MEYICKVKYNFPKEQISNGNYDRNILSLYPKAI